MYAVTTDAMEANGGPQRSNNKGLRPERLVEAAAKDFEGFDDWKAGKRKVGALTTEGDAGKRQVPTLEQQRLTAGLGGSRRDGFGAF